FEAQVVRGPNVKALKWDDEELSYAELNRRANRLAHVLRSEGVTHETPIGVFLQPSIDLIVVLLAVNKAGGTYIPMDPTHPISRLEFMIQESEVLLVVTHRATGRMLPEERTREFNLDTNSARLARAPDDNLPVSGNGDSRLYIRYTSGSTGRPKGIELTSRAISRLVINTKHVPVVPGDRVSQLSNPSFDVFAFEMWIALLNGAQLVGVSRNLPLRPAEFATFIAKEHLSVMVLTTAMFNFVARECPDAFTPLKALVVGGEALVPKWIRKVLENNPPAALVNGYGPTEAAVFSTFHLIQEVLEGANSIPIGRPFNGSTIHILNDNLEPVAVGERGELFIGGPGVARGYFNHPKRTAEKFIDDPFRKGGKLYRSGDMGRWLPNGVVDFVGRCDNQVKIRSFRVELGDIESILREDKLVSDAAVLALDEDGTDSKRLVAYIEPKDTSLHADRSLAIDAVSALRCRLAKSLPPYMIPTAYALLEKMPFSNNRKIDRQGLVNVELLKMNKTAGYVAPANETEKFIAELWAELLDLERVSTEADWIQLGGTSLLAANQLLCIHEKIDANISAHQFYANATVKQLARQVDEMRGGQKVDVSEFSRVDLHREAHLDRQVKPDPKAPPYRWCSPNQVLVTGATGFLAAWVVRDLLLKTGATVYCLVRAGGASEAMSRLRQNMQHYRVWDNAFASRIVAVPGDLTKRELGMPRQDYIELAGKIDTIFHSAAHVNYIEPYAWHKAANVHGTIEMIRFAFRSKIKALHHLSTISIFGPNGLFDGVQDIYEDTDIDASARLLHLDMGYSQSKWVAEKLLSQAQERGLPVSLY
ncbi:MAG: amino acid adenylation domain-containing protein, partial [Nannocystaceae bacterium]